MAKNVLRALCVNSFCKISLPADAHGELKLNCWEAPTNIAAWKEEHVRSCHSCL
jgi:hypothetical protein